MSTNGALPSTLLAPVKPGMYLRNDAAASLLRLLADLPTITGPTDDSHCYRTYAEQERIFRLNYTTVYTQYVPGKVDRRVWNGKAWYRRKGGVSAAVPGTSNHGWGVAVDFQGLGGFTGTDYKTMTTKAPAYGWNNDEGRTIGEAWHWVYDPDDDTHKGDGVELKDVITLSQWMNDQMPGDLTRLTVNSAMGYMATGIYTTANSTKAAAKSLVTLVADGKVSGANEKAIIANQMATLAKLDELIAAVKTITVNVAVEIPPVTVNVPAFDFTGHMTPKEG